MGDVLDVEVEAAPSTERASAESGVPRWGLPAAIALVGMLMLALAVAVVARGSDGSAPSSPPAGSEPPAEPPAAETTDPVIEALEEALAAWGRFAVDGDLSHLDGLFHPDGPQYRQLAEEAEAIADARRPGPAYRVLRGSTRTLESAPAEVMLQARVSWTRPGESPRSYEWWVLMHPRDGRWVLWTVHEQP